LKQGTIDKCSVVIEKAAGLGISLPTTTGQLRSECAPAAPDAAPKACTEGMVGQLHKLAPECINECHDSCGALGHVLEAYTNSGEAEAKGEVCQRQEAFECFLKQGTIDKCSVVIEKAAGLGISLPTTTGQLRSECAPAARDAAAVASPPAAEEVDPCMQGSVGQLRNLAPECFDQCQEACGAVKSVLMSHSNAEQVEAVKEQFCKHRGAFECFIEKGIIDQCWSVLDSRVLDCVVRKDVAGGACAPVLAAAREAGGEAPSKRDLRRFCGARLRGSAALPPFVP